MVSRAAPALTRIGFRRDVKLFLALLVGFFVVLVLVLLLLLQNAVLEAEAAMRRERDLIADAAAAAIDRVGAASPEAYRPALSDLRTRYGLASVALITPAQRRVVAGESSVAGGGVTRRTGAGTLVLSFHESELTSLRRRFLLTASITIVAVAAGTILLLLYTPKITRPIERLLDEASRVEEHDPAVDEQEYLIDTFRKTIATLRDQEDELRRLHDQQKTRADDFERVAAALTRNLSSGFIALDPTGRVVDVNQAGREILRIGRDDAVVAKVVEETPAPAELASVLQQASSMRQSLTRREIDCVSAGGERLIIGVTTVPLLNADSAYLGLIALFTDVTPIRELENRMREMQTLADFGEMSAGIAHEFRNSLSTIMGYLRLAQRQSDPAAMKEKMRKAEEEAALLSSAITSLLNFTRSFTIDSQRVDLREVVDDVVGRLEPHAPEVRFTVGGEAEVEGDRGLLARAVENIIRNAIDAVREAGRDGRVEIALQPDPPAVVVRDNGSGLTGDETARSVFVPFRSNKPGGYGLGLPLAKKIALLHGGTISLAPRAEGGAVATITFSRAAAQPPATPQAQQVLR